MPVLGVAHSENEVDDLGSSFLPFLNSFRGVWMGTQRISSVAARRLLPKHSRAIGEGVANGCLELPENLSQRLFEILVDPYVLVVTEESMRQIFETANIVICVIFPIYR
jgi:hypothetical protein